VGYRVRNGIRGFFPFDYAQGQNDNVQLTVHAL
jgi:hypothetical protein